MSSFFNQLSQIEIPAGDTPESTHNNSHAVPTPGEVAATERLLHDQFAALLPTAPTEENSELLESLMRFVEEQIEHPPEKPAGVPQSYLDALDRVPKKDLKKTDSCPICAEVFLDDPYPLVVQLPCHPSHIFDLECVGPWLRLQGTCPLDRKNLLKKKEVPKPVEDDEEEWDTLYA